MNKLVKGSIAGAAGIALLLGGAGTFALWSDSASVQAGTVTAGKLTLDVAPSSAKWADISAERGGTPAPIDITTFRIVPGDKLQLTQVVTLEATGDNLEAELTIDSTFMGDDLAEYLTFDLAVDDGDRNNVTQLSPTSNVFDVKASKADGEFDVTITATVEFPNKEDQGTAGQDMDLDLSKVGLKLEQTRDLPTQP